MVDIVKISVRTLVEHVLRSGSMETGFRTAASLTEGTKAHQKIQKRTKKQIKRKCMSKRKYHMKT